MRGHLPQRGKDSWRVKVYVGRSADGAKRYLEQTVRGTRREAERELARLIVEVDEGRHAKSYREALEARDLDYVDPELAELYELARRGGNAAAS